MSEIHGIEISLRYGAKDGMIIWSDVGNELARIDKRLSWEEIYHIMLCCKGIHCHAFKNDDWDVYSMEELERLSGYYG